MATSFIKSRGPRVISNIITNGQLNAGIPDIVFPNVDKDITTPSALYAAFTMTGSSATLTSSTEGVITPSNCTLRESSNVNPHVGSAVMFAATARRKPGTTGAIAAQTLTISVNSVEIGRLAILATTDAVDPVCGYVLFYNSAGDSRVNLASYPITVAGTADADLEIVIWVVGT